LVRTQTDLAGDVVDSEESRDPVSFEAFFRREYAVVMRIAYGIVRDHHRAEDVAQDVFISAEQRFVGRYDSKDAVGWVRIAASHLGLNAIRGERRRIARETRERRPSSLPGPEERVLANETREQVRAALAKLPRHAATVLVLRHGGLSYAEVAEAMGVRVGQIGTMLRRAEAKLRKEIEHAARS
jgi:RNA polymerase sigma factor (sigma-70 family)